MEKEAETHRRLLTAALEHRIKNTLAVVQSIVSQSLRTVATPEEARDAIGERLTALSHAHDLLTQSSWRAAPLAMIVGGATHLHSEKSGRIVIEGPDIELSARAALAFSMSLHELSTNAAKYGALSSESGHSNCAGRSSTMALTPSWTFAGRNMAGRPSVRLNEPGSGRG